MTGRNTIALGSLNRAMEPAAWSISSWASTLPPSTSATIATTSCPHRSLGRPDTTTSATAGCDAHRIAAEQFDGAVCEKAGAIARHRVPDTVDYGQRGRRLGRISLVAQWHI